MPSITAGSPPRSARVTRRQPGTESASPPLIAVACPHPPREAGAVIVPAAIPRPIGVNSSAEARGE